MFTRGLSGKLANVVPRQFVLGLLLVIAIVVSYIPAIRGGYIWDDDHHITNNKTLRTGEGLEKIWFDTRSTPQYYPVVHTSFWLEYRLWHLNPSGYHAVNVLLHAVNSLLVWIILRALGFPGAWLVAAIFGMHPVHVESVAWITQRKNVLSAFFYLLSIMMYLRFIGIVGAADVNRGSASQGNRSWRLYFPALIFYLMAILSKTVTVSLPAAILVVVWWKRGKVHLKDIYPLIPFFFIGIPMGLTTAWLERHHVGAAGSLWDLSFLDRTLIAGRAVWFYAKQLIWPSNLIFIYPRWVVDPGLWWQYLYPLGVILLISSLLFLRARIGRGPLAAVLFFVGTLFPALSFFNVYPFRYSFVADHFQYLASIGLIALGMGGLALCSKAIEARFQRREEPVRSFLPSLTLIFAFISLTVLSLLTWRQGQIYKDETALWRDTISKNPGAWMAYNNLGKIRSDKGDYTEAVALYTKAVELKPDLTEALYNLGLAFDLQGKTEMATSYYLKTLGKDPRYAEAYSNLGAIWADQGRLAEAIAAYRKALEIKPNLMETHLNLAVDLEAMGDIYGAASEYREVLKLNPNHPRAAASLRRLSSHTSSGPRQDTSLDQRPLP